MFKYFVYIIILDFSREPFTGDVDTTNNFCYIASSQTCFVWKYSQTLLGMPTCHIFPCAANTSTLSSPFVCLPSLGPSREPALLLLSTAGEIRFWNSIGMGLTGGDHWDASFLDLNEDEFVTSFTKARVSHMLSLYNQKFSNLCIVKHVAVIFHSIHHRRPLVSPFHFDYIW